MKSFLIGFIVVGALTGLYTHADTGPMCGLLLKIPKKFRPAFKNYTDSRFLQMPEKMMIGFEFNPDGTVTHKVVVDTVGDALKISADIIFDSENKSIMIQKISIPDRMSSVFGIKLLFALYLERYPKIKNIQMVMSSISLSILKEELAKGESMESAFVQTPIFEALDSLGFTKIRVLDFPNPAQAEFRASISK